MRPRTFKPNILNIPRYVTDYIKHAFKKAYVLLNIKETKDGLDFSNANLNMFNSLVNTFKQNSAIKQDLSIEEFKPYGIRECFRVPDGKWLIDADYATAEVFAIAYLANDKKLISTLTQPDPQFAIKKMPDGTEKNVRIAYIDDIVEFSEKAKDPSLLHDINDPTLLRDENGNLKHPKQDVHWMAVENKFLMDTPREKLDKDKTRDAAGKISNFCSGKDNYILTYSNGYKRASEVKVGDILRGIRGKTTVKSVTRLNNQDCIELQLDSGIIATFHKMHRLRCWNGKSLVWKRVKNLTSEDQIITFNNINLDKKYKNEDILFSHATGTNIIYKQLLDKNDICSIVDIALKYPFISILGLSTKYILDYIKNFIIENKELRNKIILLLKLANYSVKIINNKIIVYNPLPIKLNSRLTSFYSSKVISKRELKDDIIAIECTTHEYIDMSLNSHNSIPYGTSAELLERQVELASGEKPEKGTGQRMIDSYMLTKPDVAKFLEKCKQTVFDPGYYQAPSGYKRHYIIPDENSGLTEKQKAKIISSVQRQACNIPLQNLVADSLARSIVAMHRYCRENKLKTRIFMPLYDCNYCEVPPEEILLIKKLIVKCMSTDNYWDLPGGRLAFTAEPEIGKACGTKLTKQEEEELSKILC